MQYFSLIIPLFDCRYGYKPLNKTLPNSEQLKECISKFSLDMKTLFDHWYIFDNNSLPNGNCVFISMFWSNQIIYKCFGFFSHL